MTRCAKQFRFVAPARARAVIVSVPRAGQSALRREASAEELSRLARGLGMDVVHHMQTSRAQSALFAENRLAELASWTGGPGPRTRAAPDPEPDTASPRADIVLVDGALTPAAQRALELASGVAVLDRSALVLRVFAERARTREAQLQVELAQRLYQAPHIRDQRAHDDRRGGGGRGERGDTGVQLAKQANRARIAELRAELDALPARAAVRRKRRGDLPQVALVGYTNAGKSSLMRALTGSAVHVADALFATLDPMVRALAAPGTRVLVSDTVGFLADLPAELIASFRATLDEARHAQLLLLVVDASDPEHTMQLEVTRDTLTAIGADDVSQQLVLNKCDRLSPGARADLARAFPDAWLVSAHDRADTVALAARLVAHFDRPGERCASPVAHELALDQSGVPRS